MRKLLITTTALSVALSSVPTLPLLAQTSEGDAAPVCAAGDPACDPAAAEKAARKAQRQAEKAAAAEAEKAQRQAEKAAAAEAEKAQRQAEKAAAAEAEKAQRQAEKAAAEQAAAEEAAAEKAAADQAAEKEAAEKAAAEATAQAEAEAQAKAEAKAERKAKARQEAEDQAAADDAAAAKAEAEAAADAAKAEAEAAADAAATEAEAAAQAAAKAERKAKARQEAEDQAAADEAAAVKADAEAAADAAKAEAEAAAEAATTEAEPTGKKGRKAEKAEEVVEAPVPEAEAVQSLESLLGQPDEAAEVAKDAGDPQVAAEPVAAAAKAKGKGGRGKKDREENAATDPGKAAGEAEAEADGDEPVNVQTQTVTEADTRTSDQEFDKAPVEVSKGKKSGLSDLEKVGLVALGALAVGTILNQGKQDQRTVVSNSGDRVVVQNPDGSYAVYKDDDAVLRRPGVETRTESFNDGSTRTVVTRADGSEVVTIRDASGRVLKRSAYDRRGIETVLIDDFYREEPIVISELPKPRPDRVTISTADSDAELRAALAADEAASWGRKFSLRQIRDIQQVRALAPTVEVDSITFDTGSAAIRASEASKLADLGRLMQGTLAQNPANVFLIEGHTDAVGSASSNLLLSDRRAESLALALTEYFDIPPENLVVQGYGESELKIAAAGDERANRRVVVRLITPLMRTAELQ